MLGGFLFRQALAGKTRHQAPNVGGTPLAGQNERLRTSGLKPFSRASGWNEYTLHSAMPWLNEGYFRSNLRLWQRVLSPEIQEPFVLPGERHPPKNEAILMTCFTTNACRNKKPPHMTQDSHFIYRPIGILRSPHSRRIDAPRQSAGGGRHGNRGFSDSHFGALGWLDEKVVQDLNGFDRLWLIFAFYMSEGWKSNAQAATGWSQSGAF